MLDLSSLNRFLTKIKFRMETSVSVRESIRAGDWATSVDLTDAYFHLLIHRLDSRWLRFVWKGNIYQFWSLPFGLSLAPLIFTKVIREFALLIRLEGIRPRVFLDDDLGCNSVVGFELARFQRSSSPPRNPSSNCSRTPRVEGREGTWMFMWRHVFRLSRSLFYTSTISR